MVRYDYAIMADYGRVYPCPIDPDEATLKRVDEITAELEQLQLEMEDEGLEYDAYNALYERLEALEEEARYLQEAYSVEDLARAGVIASWSSGQVTLHVGLVRPEDTVKDKAKRGASTRCLIPRFDGAIHSMEWKEALRDKFVTAAPRLLTPSEQQYSDRKLRTRR